MQKISIKNFGPIESIENLGVSKILLLIGQQASGKSTISKLIYFFKSLREDLLSCLEEHEYVKEISNEGKKLASRFESKCRSRFYTFFGSTKLEKFVIDFQYGDRQILTISPDNFGSICLHNNDAWFVKRVSLLVAKWNEFLHLTQETNNSTTQTKEGAADALLRRKEERKLANLRNEIDRLIDGFFGEEETKYPRLIFIPAGRSLLSSLKQSFQSKVIDEFISLFREEKEFEERKAYFDFFVRAFFENIDEIKTKVLFGKSLDEVIQEFEILENKTYEKAREFRSKMASILKADYRVDGYGERLFSESFKKPILLDYASSGQQEVIWILLQLFALILEEQPAFVVIEEPEAHLYPTAQVAVMNLISLFLSANPSNQVIITTHSPYLLTAANNLLFAKRVAEKTQGDSVKAESIKEAIGIGEFFDPNDFGAFYLSENKITSLFNPETGVISQSQLDDASDAIMDSFDALMEIYKQN
jgi:predicted ATP-dependent endonuclease of OLD family